MSFNPDPPNQDDLQSDQIRALLEGQHQLAKQMAEIVLAHQAIVRRHEEDLPRIERIERAIENNSLMTAEVKEMVSAVAAIKGGLRVLSWLNPVAKWIGSVAVFLGAVYLLLYMMTHGGQLPPGK